MRAADDLNALGTLAARALGEHECNDQQKNCKNGIPSREAGDVIVTVYCEWFRAEGG